MGRARGGGKGHSNRGSAGQNRAAGAAYLARNASRPGVVTTASGLQIEVIDEGDGPAPWAGCRVTTHQRTSLVDGKMIQDTYRDGRPDTFPLDEAVPGFREGVLAMRVGGRARLTVPPDLAWGRKGAGSSIGPNQVLIFDVRVLEAMP